MDPLRSKSGVSKSYRMIKIKRKPRDYDDYEESVEEDYALEKGGDIQNFLKSKFSKIICPRYDENGEIVSHSIIGPLGLFSNEQKDPQNQNKKSGNNPKKKRRDTHVDPKHRFKQILDQISTIKKSAVHEEQQKLKVYSQRQRLAESRQDQVIKSFQKTVKYWNSIERTIAKKTKKTPKDLLSTKSITYRSRNSTPDKLNTSQNNSLETRMGWYMRLRESKNDEKFEAYLKVGSEYGGLFTKVTVKNNQDYYPENKECLSEEEIKELQVIGISKLPMEIEAVNKVGCQFLKPELLDGNKDEEVIEEHYDRKIKARLI